MISIRTTAVAFALTAMPALGAEIGAVTAVQPAMRGAPPAQAERTLSLGLDVFENEVVTSGPTGRGQLQFDDQTTLTIAPDSRVTLDRFVYDPDRDTGDVAVGLARGALRFIGGRITKSSEGIITTPTATIGVRGAIVLVRLTEAGFDAILVAGERICVWLDPAERKCASRQGAWMDQDGYRGRANADLIDEVLGRIDGEIVVDARLRGADVGSGDGTAPDRAQLSTTGEERGLDQFDDPLHQRVLDERTVGAPLGGGGNVNAPPPEPPGDGGEDPLPPVVEDPPPPVVEDPPPAEEDPAPPVEEEPLPPVDEV